MGTNIVSGSAQAVVLSTGIQTYFGALAHRVTATDRSTTAFQMGVNKVSWLLIRFMLVMAPVVLFINGFTKGDWAEAFFIRIICSCRSYSRNATDDCDFNFAKGRFSYLKESDC